MPKYALLTEDIAKIKLEDRRAYLEEKLKEAGFNLDKEVFKRPASTIEYGVEYYNSYEYYQ